MNESTARTNDNESVVNNDDDLSSHASMPPFYASNQDEEYEADSSVVSSGGEGSDDSSTGTDDDFAFDDDSDVVSLVARNNAEGLRAVDLSDGEGSESADDLPRLVNHENSSSSDDDSMPPMLDGADGSDLSDNDSVPPLIRRYRSSSEDSMASDSTPWKLTITTFPQLMELSDDVVINILSFVAFVPFEKESKLPGAEFGVSPFGHESTVTHVLPLVCKHFRNLCDDSTQYFWKMGLERLITREPMLWKEGLLRLLPDTLESPDEPPRGLVERVFDTVGPENYKELFRQVLGRYVRVTGPVFYMPGSARLGNQFGVHLEEPRYRLMISNLLESFPESAQEGEDIVANENGELPTFIYSNSSPLRAGSHACMVQVQHCIIHEDGTADASIMPIAYVRMERVWVVPETNALHHAVCVRLGRDASRRHERTMSFPHIEFLDFLAGGEPRNVGIRGTIRMILQHLVAQGDEAMAEMNLVIPDDMDDPFFRRGLHGRGDDGDDSDSDDDTDDEPPPPLRRDDPDDDNEEDEMDDLPPLVPRFAG